MGTTMVVAVFAFLFGFFLRHGMGRYFERAFSEVVALLGSGVMAISAERARQQSEEGWAIERDVLMYNNDELVRAAVCYATGYAIGNPVSWPWTFRWWKPSTKRRNLVKAGALIAAEIDRMDASEKMGV